MRAVLILASAMLACSTAAHAADDPLAPAREGQLQCYMSDAARKTCGSLAGYSWDAKGAITNRAEVMLAPNPVTTMVSTTPVTVRDGAVCGPIRAEDLEAAEIRVGGAPASAEVAASVHKQVAAAMSFAIGHEFCTTYVPTKDGLKAQVTVDGTAHPEMSAIVTWVKPGDGYKVAP